MINLTYELYRHAENEGVKKGRKEGIAIGDEARVRDVYKFMKEEHMDDTRIMKCLRITKDQLDELQKHIRSEVTVTS